MAHLPQRLKSRLKQSRLAIRVRGVVREPEIPAPLCVLPWIHAHVATTGDVHLCCLALAPDMSLGNVHGQSLTDVFRSGSFDRVRQQMLKGEWPRECRGCQDRENLGLPSYRHFSNSKYPGYARQLTLKPAAVEPVIRSADLRLNNICNLKCRSCGVTASNRWLSDHNFLYPQDRIEKSYQGFDKDPSFWVEFDEKMLPGLEELDLAGGEPLLSQSQYKLLEKLIAQGKQDIRLHITTNLSQLRFMQWDAIELWRKFPNLELVISLDGVGAQGEYIRHGLNYARWVENIQRVKQELPNVKRCLHFVVSILNVTDLRGHYETIIRGEFVNPNLITFTFLNWPAYMSIQVLRPELKHRVERDVREWLSESPEMPQPVRAQLNALIQFMNEADGYATYGHEFLSTTKLLDQARGENAQVLFPKLESMLVS